MKGRNTLFESFLQSDDTVWFLRGEERVFQSQKKGIAPLLEYLDLFDTHDEGEVIVFDRVVGNAAALLVKLAQCREVYAALASEPAVETLNGFDIPGRFQKIVPHIINRKGTGMCPFERLSIGKSPADFYKLAQNKLKSLNGQDNFL